MAPLPAFLKSVDLFRGMSDADLARIAADLQLRTVHAGTSLFEEGDEGHSVYLIADGSIRIEKDGVQLATRRTGDCVGEFALLDDGRRSASAIAGSDSSILEWPRAAVFEALSAAPDLSRRVFGLLVAKLREDVGTQVETAIARERVQQDLRRAGEIQRAMLAPSEFRNADVCISGLSCPAIDVGGDYFDHALTGERTVSALLADVSGHGIYAALLVALAKASFQTQLHLDSQTSAIMQAMNRSLWLSVRAGMLMTCVSANIDSANGLLSYTNAGHPAPLHFSAATGVVAGLDATDPLLGLEVFRDAEFQRATAPWARGDVLLMYTDGVTEATDGADEQFGRARLEHILRESGLLPADAIRGRVFDELARFTGGRPQEDDATVVVVQAR